MNQTAAGLCATLDDLASRLEAPAQDARDDVVRELLELVARNPRDDALAGLPAAQVTARRTQFAPPVLAFIAGQEHLEGQRLRERACARDGTLGGLLGPNRWGAYRGMERVLDLDFLTGCERIAMVGCGPFPDSLFCLHDRTPAALTGFDSDPAAVVAAAELVSALGLERATIAAGDGARLDYGEFDAVCCSVFAEPRRAVLARVAATAPPGAVVVAREPTGAARLIFEPVLDELPAGLALRARSNAPTGPLGLVYAALVVTDSRNERSMNPSGMPST